MTGPITLTCPEGFSYHSFQRVVATDGAGNNVSRLVYELLCSCPENTYPDNPDEPGEVNLVYCPAPACLFVRGAESFAVGDFAELVDEACGVPVRYDWMEDGTWQTTRD